MEVGDRVIWSPLRKYGDKETQINGEIRLIDTETKSVNLVNIIFTYEGFLENRWVHLEELTIDTQYYRELKINRILDV